jgi:DNA-binding CsgD family transcriptional regulator
LIERIWPPAAPAAKDLPGQGIGRSLRTRHTRLQGTPITHAMRVFFEILWTRATPFCSAMRDGAPLDSTERRILELLTASKQDSSIAAAMDISESTVRRHIKVIADRLEMNNPSRFALGYEIARRGWLTSPADSPATSKEQHA